MRFICRILRPSLAAALGAAAIGGAVGAVAIMSGAHAATLVPVSGLPGFGQVAVDMAASRVFVSEGTNASSSYSTTPAQGIVVMDLSGNYLTTIDEGTGAEGLTVATDGTLYAALSTEGVVAGIDPATYSETDYPLPAGDAPEHVAAQSGKVWVSYDAGTAGAVGDITPGATSSFQPDSTFTPPGISWSTAPLLAADPSDGGTIVAASPGQASLNVASFDVSGATPAVKAAGSPLPDCASQAVQVAVLPGGGRFLIDCNDGGISERLGDHWQYSTADLSEQNTGPYTSPVGSGSIAVAPDGAVAAGSVIDSTTSAQQPDLNVFSPGTGLIGQSYALEASWGAPYGNVRSLAPGGLAWGDSTVLAAVMAGTTGDSTAPYIYQVRIITSPLLPQPALVMKGLQQVQLGTAINISGALSVDSSSVAGKTVTISRSLPGGTPVQVGQATTDSAGNFTVSDTPRAQGTYTYAASFDGDSTLAPITATVTVRVLNAAHITLQVPSTATAGQSFEVTGVLTINGAPAPGQTVTICRNSGGNTFPTDCTGLPPGGCLPTPQACGTPVVLGQVVTNSDGAFTIPDTPPAGSDTYSAYFPADNIVTASAFAKATMMVLNPTTLSLSGPAIDPHDQVITLTGALGGPSTEVGGQTLAVTRFDPTNPGGVALPDVTTAADGSFTLTDTPPKANMDTGTVTYQVSYAGDATLAASTTSTSVTIHYNAS